MTSEPLIPNPTLQLYVAVDPSSVSEYTVAVEFTTTGGGPQSVTRNINRWFADFGVGRPRVKEFPNH